MTASLSNKARAEPNLTPILDMVFQLITFFMLVINFKANLMDKAMDLPVIGSARPLDKDDKRSFFMLNLNNKGQFTIISRPRLKSTSWRSGAHTPISIPTRMNCRRRSLSELTKARNSKRFIA
jgi:biopolymer transport protein ExbD